MKLLTLLFSLIIFQKAFSQTTTIQGQVTDKSTKKPLAYANLYLAKSGFGTVTNQSGNFIFKYQADMKHDTAVFSYVGYKPFKVSLKNVTGPLRIALELQPVVMQELVVKPLDPLVIVSNSLAKIPVNYNFKAHMVEGFQREYVKQADQFIQLLEVAFATNMKEGAKVPNSTVLQARYMEDKKEKAPLFSAFRGGFYTFGWTAVSGIENPSASNFLGVNLNKKSDLAKYYEFETKDLIRSENQEWYVIAFNQKLKVRQPLLKGLLYIDAESGAIVKITYALSPRGIKYLKPHETWGNKKLSSPPKKINVTNDRGEITYKKYGSKWYLNTVVMDTNFDASLVFLRMVLAQKNALRLHSEQIVTAIDTTAGVLNNAIPQVTDVGSIPTLQNFIKKNYENYEEVNEEKWSDFNFIQSDTAIATIAKQLKINNQQWETYQKQEVLAKAIAKSNYTSRRLSEDVDYLKETLEKVHPGLYWYTDKATLDKAFTTVKERLGKKNTEADFFQLLSPAIAKIHCGHTTLLPSVVSTEYQKVYKKLFPLDLGISHDSAIVLTAAAGISKGASVLAINGYEIPQIIKKIQANVAADGFNNTYKAFLLQTNFAGYFAQHYAGKDTFDIKIADITGQIKNVKVVGKTEKPASNEKMKGSALQILDSLQTAILTIPSFTGTPDFPLFLQQTFAQIKQKNTQNLIIDLRNNQGGKDEYGQLLFSYLAREPFHYYSQISVATRDTTILNRLNFGEIPFQAAVPDYLASIQEQDGAYRYSAHSNLGIHQPNRNAFNGAVYILMNGGTFSTAAEFAAIAHSNKRAVFIGEETGGGYYGNCSLGTPTLTLPHSQIRITIPLAKYQLAVSKRMPVGRGVIPDHPTTYNSQDMLQKTDKEIALCFRIIQKSKNLKK